MDTQDATEEKALHDIAISHALIRAPRTYVEADEEKMLELRWACDQGSSRPPHPTAEERDGGRGK